MLFAPRSVPRSTLLNSTKLSVAIATQAPLSIDAVAPHLPDDLRSIIRDCLAPIEDRLSSALELAARLEAALVNSALEGLPLPPPKHAPTEGRALTTGGRLRVGRERLCEAVGRERD